MLRTTADELDRLLSPAHIMGEAVDLGDKAVIPVAEFGFGFGAGTASGKDSCNGFGSGGGGGISPVALVIVHKDVRGPEGIQVLSLRKDNPVAQVISALSESLAPQVIAAIKAMQDKKENTEGT
ncbi:MAG: sporulation protein [Methanolinea sp.]|nr:sporulation protein [Methanolinea sp.]